ncbi:MAG: flagellar hook-length control protein FliK [Treponema sp.]|nr:flagellar hook-length control protein FliK [Treponema sp.]
MLIAITAQTSFDYTEPIPVDTSVREHQQVHDEEKAEESSSFAQLLAGLLQVQPAETEHGFDLSVEKIQDVNMPELGEFIEFTKFDNFAKVSEGLVNPDSIDIDLSADDLSNAIGTEQFFINSLNTDDLGDDLSVLSQKTDVKISNKSAESAEKIMPDNGASSQLLSGLETASKHKNEDTLSADAKKKITKEISAEDLPKNEKAQPVYTLNNNREEKETSFDKKPDNTGRLDEFRSRMRKDRAVFDINNMRTNTGNAEGAAFNMVEAAASRNMSSGSIQEVTLDLRLPENGQGSLAQTTWEAKAGTAMESLLARELHQNFNGDIVRHASMILRNGGEGIIRIALHPETLGNVKIHLQMTENKITGIIVVDSEEALNAFRKEMSALEQAFKEAGFENASLDLSLSSDGANANQQELDASALLNTAMRNAASGYDDSHEAELPVLDVLFGRADGQRTGSVNVLA